MKTEFLTQNCDKTRERANISTLCVENQNRRACLTLTAEKCDFFRRTVAFVLSDNQIRLAAAPGLPWQEPPAALGTQSFVESAGWTWHLKGRGWFLWENVNEEPARHTPQTDVPQAAALCQSGMETVSESALSGYNILLPTLEFSKRNPTWFLTSKNEAMYLRREDSWSPASLPGALSTWCLSSLLSHGRCCISTWDTHVKEGGPAREELMAWLWMEMIAEQWNEGAQCQRRLLVVKNKMGAVRGSSSFSELCLNKEWHVQRHGEEGSASGAVWTDSHVEQSDIGLG